MATQKEKDMTTEEQLERIVMEEFSRAEQEGIHISRDCEVTLARRVAKRVMHEAAHLLAELGMKE